MELPNFTTQLDVEDTTVTIRAMRPTDRDLEERFVNGLSELSRYLRFHYALKQITDTMLERFINVSYPDEMALIATIPEGDGERQIGVARYVRESGKESAEVAVVVDDRWQDKGVGTQLLLSLRELALQAGIKHLEVTVLPENMRMLTLAEKLGFKLHPRHGDYSTVELGKDLDEDGAE